MVDGTNAQGLRKLVFTKSLDNGLQIVRTVEDRGEAYKFDLTVTVVNVGGKDVPARSRSCCRPVHGLFDENDGHTLLMLPPTALAAVRNRDGDVAVTKWAGKDLKDGTSRKIGEGETLVVAGSMTQLLHHVGGRRTTAATVALSAARAGAGRGAAGAGRRPRAT